MGPDVSIVLPAYNEAETIEGSVRKVRDASLKLDRPFEIIIAENGSTDGTDVISKRLSEEYEEVEYLHTEKGRGNALRAAFSSSRGGIIVYMDVDLAADLKHLGEIIEAIDGGHDFATGSRLLPQSTVEGRLTRREIASRGYNFLVRTLLKSKIRDHQCGFKAFKRDSILEIIGEVKDNYWFLDTEILVRAQRRGYKVAEIPIHWRDTQESKVDIVRDIMGMGSSIFRLYWDFTGSEFMSIRGKFFIDLSLGLMLLSLIALFVGYSNVLNALFSASIPIILFACLFFSVSYLVRGIRYTYILRSVEVGETLRFLTGTVLLSQLANLFLPSRLGDAVRPMILKDKRGIDFNVGFASVTIERMFDVIAITSVAMISYISILTPRKLPGWVDYLMGSAFILVFVILIFLFFISFRIKWLKATFKRILYKISTPGAYTDEVLFMLKRYVSNISMSLHNLSLTISVIAYTFMVWVFEATTCLLVFKALGVSVPLPVVFLAISLGNLVKIFPTTPSSIGIYEGVLMGIFVISGIPAKFAFSAALLDHLVKNVVTLLLGSVAMFKFDVGLKEMEDRVSTRK